MTTTIIVSTAEVNIWRCEGGQGGTHPIVEWYDPGQEPRCPACGQSLLRPGRAK